MATVNTGAAINMQHSSPSKENPKKRKFEEESNSDQVGMEQLSSLPPKPDLPEFNLTSAKRSSHESELPRDDDSRPDDWQTVDRHQKKKAKKTPKTGSNNYPSFDFSSNSRLNSQVKISDLQNLVLYILADGPSPQFVSVRHRPAIRKVVVLMVPGLEMSMFAEARKSETHSGRGDKAYTSPDEYYPTKLRSESLPEEVRLFADMFEYIWPVKTPSDDKYLRMHSPLHAMLTAPLTKSNEEKRAKKQGRGAAPAKEPHGWKNNRVPIPEFILTLEELLDNDYPIHPASYSDENDKKTLEEYRQSKGISGDDGWVDTLVKHYDEGIPPDKEIEAGSITAGRDVISMDCEMCMTGPEEFSLTRISLVGWDGSVLLDELVKPDKTITNYVTQFSGITEEMLKPVNTTLRDIQERLLEILHPRTVLIGHSLNSDLNALKITHPYIIDTAVLYPHPRGPPLKSSLKWLAQKYLSREIQKGHGTTGPGAGHNSIEDAKTCLDLVKQKCEKGKDWGTSDAQGENIFKRVARTGVHYKSHGESAIANITPGKTSAAVDWGNPKKGAGAGANFSIGCRNDEEVMEGIIRAIKGDDDGKEIPGGGVDFIWGRLRELEALKGWWNENRQVSTNALAKDNNTSFNVQNGQSSIDSSTDGNSTVVENPFKAPGPNGTATQNPSSKDAESWLQTATETSNRSTSLPTNSLPPPDLDSSKTITQATADLTQRLAKIHSSLPPCTAFIIYSGSGDPREMGRLQAMQTTFKREYKIKKWDQLSVKWTDTEEQALRKAHLVAKNGVGFVVVK